METSDVISKIGDFESFPTLEEMNKKAFNAERYGFKVNQIGKSLEGRPIYMIKAGEGKKKALVWGFPHPNEPIGALTID